MTYLDMCLDDMVGLNMDGLTAVKEPEDAANEVHDDEGKAAC